MSPSDRRFHFISGLPRSGSTLTAALLRQNPRFHAGMSSPVASLFEGLIAQVSAGTELSTMVDQAQRMRLFPEAGLLRLVRDVARTMPVAGDGLGSAAR